MRYRVEGNTLPVAILQLEAGESIISEAGGRNWSRGMIETETQARGGAAKSIGRMFAGESLFMSKYTAKAPAEIAFASSFPGRILVRELKAGESIICQKSAFLAATSGVDVSIYFQKRLASGFFSGEGFIMQKLTGPGLVFLELDGHVVEYDLAAGERLTCDTGVLAVMSQSCTMSVEMVKGLKNMIFGREGLFDTVITGPGKVYLQSMTKAHLAAMLGYTVNK